MVDRWDKGDRAGLIPANGTNGKDASRRRGSDTEFADEDGACNGRDEVKRWCEVQETGRSEAVPNVGVGGCVRHEVVSRHGYELIRAELIKRPSLMGATVRVLRLFRIVKWLSL